MLNTNRDSTPDLMPGMDEDEGDGVRYRNMEDMSDSEEEDMAMSEDEEVDEEGNLVQPRKKQARIGDKADGDSKPKWSNPDPYTALPPPDESQRKKKDVVKLIRKARVVAQKGDASKEEAEADDFISFDFGAEPEEEELSSEEDAPAGRYSHRDVIQKILPSANEAGVSRRGQEEEMVLKTITPNPLDVWPPPAPSALPPPPPPPPSDPSLGSRKRTYDDHLKGPPPPQKVGRHPSDGSILREWKVKSHLNSTPWLEVDHSKTENMGFW